VSRSPTHRLAGALGLVAAVALAGCDAEATDVGKPCEVKSDCAGTLICDVHEGRGSCQENHMHSEGAAVGVRWIDVEASDYKLELVPDFDPEVVEYEARADGEGIEVYVDVLLDGDADGVLVNGHAANTAGFRAWRSPGNADLIAPTTATIEVLSAGETTAVYDLDITIPQ